MGILVRAKPASLSTVIPVVLPLHFLGLLQNPHLPGPVPKGKNITNLIALKLFLVCKMDFSAAVWDVFLLNVHLCYG